MRVPQSGLLFVVITVVVVGLITQRAHSLRFRYFRIAPCGGVGSEQMELELELIGFSSNRVDTFDNGTC